MSGTDPSSPPYRRHPRFHERSGSPERQLPSRAAYVPKRDGRSTFRRMPIPISSGAPTLLVRKDAFERAGLTRAALDERLNLTADEFRVEGALVAIGPLVGEQALAALIEELEGMGLEYFEDFFELSGNWPEWLLLHAHVRG